MEETAECFTASDDIAPPPSALAPEERSPGKVTPARAGFACVRAIFHMQFCHSRRPAVASPAFADSSALTTRLLDLSAVESLPRQRTSRIPFRQHRHGFGSFAVQDAAHRRAAFRADSTSTWIRLGGSLRTISRRSSEELGHVESQATKDRWRTDG